MAAVDRLYVYSYKEYTEFLIWCISYYPGMLRYFYNLYVTPEYFDEQTERFKKETIRNCFNFRINYMPFDTLDEALKNLKAYYKKDSNVIANDELLKIEIIDNEYLLGLNPEELAERFKYPIATLPCEYDVILKWRCPIPFVRKYLHNQCGVKTKYEWFYKLFWKRLK